MTEKTTGKNLFFNTAAYHQFHQFLKEHTFSGIFILVDSHTHAFCLPTLLGQIETEVPIEVIEMETGEAHKTIETCEGIWSALSELGADRKSLLVNLGGGVVTDLGGFVAATFKRGIACVHFPTTLLAMVDAAVGGKNGVNLDSLKNQIGIIREPSLVLADTSFLATLPPSEMRSGLAEMLKHGLIQDEDYWTRLADLSSLDLNDLQDLIAESVEIKQRIVREDPTEQHIRKSLNFGHTLGHAIESYFLDSTSKEKLLHGEAVAVGMVLAAYISAELEGFPREKLGAIKSLTHSLYGKIPFTREDQDQIIHLLKFDKKNEAGKINFVLLRNIGVPVLDRGVPNELIYNAFRYYSE